jgi:four helix bundle protein
MAYASFEELEVWKRSCRLAVEVYGLLRDCRDFGLKDQMTRAAVSIPSNVEEGAERLHKEFAQFLTIAGGSLSELDTQIEIAFKLNYLTSQQYEQLQSAMESIAMKLAGLISHVRRKAS